MPYKNGTPLVALHLETGAAINYSGVHTAAEIRKGYEMKLCNTVSVHDIIIIIIIVVKEELPEEWKESIIVPIYKKGDKTDCNNYRGISLLPTTYKILSNILLQRLTPYAEEIIGDRQCVFRRNR